MHLSAEFPQIDHTRTVCARCLPNGISMPTDATALQLVLSGDPALFAIVRLSLYVSLSAVVLAALIGIPLGAFIALTKFRGRQGVIVLLNALMGLPPVVVGLAVYLALSRSGPLGAFGLLFTPRAMIVAQTVLVTPIIAALTRQTIEDLWIEYRDELTAMNLGPLGRVTALIWDARFSLVTALLAGFGRAAAEVGAIIIVGGNIEGFTRTMTTAIALETSKGDLPLAVGLGLVHGVHNGVAMQQAGAGVLGLMGMLTALVVLVALVAACVVSLHQPWARMVVRVAGSWLAAIGLLMLGWALRGGNGLLR
jgi:tungstate transport system permease protein